MSLGIASSVDDGNAQKLDRFTDVRELQRETGQSLSELVSGMTRFPQTLLNVRVDGRIDIDSNAALGEAGASAEAQLKLARANAQRYANLVESGDVSRSAYDSAKTSVDTAQAQVNPARQGRAHRSFL